MAAILPLSSSYTIAQIFQICADATLHAGFYHLEFSAFKKLKELFASDKERTTITQVLNNIATSPEAADKEKLNCCLNALLLEAVKTKDITTVEVLLSSQVKGNILLIENQMPPLALAIGQGSTSIVELFFKYHKEYSVSLLKLPIVNNLAHQQIMIEKSNQLLNLLKQYNIALEITVTQHDFLAAVRTGNLEVIKWLIEERQVIYDRELYREVSPLLLAGKAGYIEIVKYLLSHGAAIDERGSHYSNLLSAAQEHLARPEWQELRLAHRSSQEFMKAAKELHEEAIDSNNVPLIKVLTDQWGHIFEQIELEMMLITTLDDYTKSSNANSRKQDKEQISGDISWLLNAGVNWQSPAIVDVLLGANALEWVCENCPEFIPCFVPFVSRMVTTNGQVDLYIKYKDQSVPFIFILLKHCQHVTAKYIYDLELCNKLLKLKDSNGNNIFHWISKYPSIKDISTIMMDAIREPSLLTAINKDGKTPLHIAIESGHAVIVLVAIKCKQGLDAHYQGYNLLQWAILQAKFAGIESSRIIDMLLPVIDISAIAEDGHGALSLAAQVGDIALIKKLRHAKFDSRQHPLIVALKNGCIEAASFILVEQICPLESMLDEKSPSLLATALDNKNSASFVMLLEQEAQRLSVDFKRLIAATGQSSHDLLIKSSINDNATFWRLLLRYADNVNLDLLFNLALSKRSLDAIKALLVKAQSFSGEWIAKLKQQDLLTEALGHPYINLLYKIELAAVTSDDIDKYCRYVVDIDTKAKSMATTKSLDNDAKDYDYISCRTILCAEIFTLRLAAIRQNVHQVVWKLHPEFIFNTSLNVKDTQLFALLTEAISYKREESVKFLFTGNLGKLSATEKKLLVDQTFSNIRMYAVVRLILLRANYWNNNNVLVMCQALETSWDNKLSQQIVMSFTALVDLILANNITVQLPKKRALEFTIAGVAYILANERFINLIEGRQSTVAELTAFLQANSKEAQDNALMMMEKKKACEFRLIALKPFFTTTSSDSRYKAWREKLQSQQQGLEQQHSAVINECIYMHNLFNYYLTSEELCRSLGRSLHKMQDFSKRHKESIAKIDACYNYALLEVRKGLALIASAQEISFAAIESAVTVELQQDNITAANAILDNFALQDQLQKCYETSRKSLTELQDLSVKHKGIMQSIERDIAKQEELNAKIKVDEEARLKWVYEQQAQLAAQQEKIAAQQQEVARKAVRHAKKLQPHNKLIEEMAKSPLFAIEVTIVNNSKAKSYLQYLLDLDKAGHGVADKRRSYQLTLSYALLKTMADLFEEFKNLNSKVLPANIATEMRNFLWHNSSLHITSKVSYSKLLQTARWLLRYLSDDNLKEVLSWYRYKKELDVKAKIGRVFNRKMRVSSNIMPDAAITSLEQLNIMYNTITESVEDAVLKNTAQDFLIGKIETLSRDNSISYNKFMPRQLTIKEFIDQAIVARHEGTKVMVITLATDLSAQIAGGDTKELLTTLYDALPKELKLMTQEVFIEQVNKEAQDTKENLLAVVGKIIGQEIIVYAKSPVLPVRYTVTNPVAPSAATPLPRPSR